jgi:beta-glucanase (GH16 family)
VAIAIGCSDDSTATAPEEQAEVPASSATIEPASSETVIQSSETIVLSSSSAGPVSYAYYGAELTGRDQFTYGRFEARMKMLSIPGSVSSMFLYYDPSYLLGKQPWNEIDIEVLGKGGTMWQSNIITREADPSIKANTSSESKPLHEFGFDATQDFHLFAIVWTPEYVAWEIDSMEIRRDTLGMERGTHADKDQVAFLTENQSLRFNLWASKSVGWVGKFTGEELAAGPQEQVIDYVRVYSYDAATKGFTQLWQDDFEGTALSDHWNVGNWEMEKVELSPFNVVVEGGFCKLRLSREEE